eukprot:868873-Prorocentrum_minimum.AAC.2
MSGMDKADLVHFGATGFQFEDLVGRFNIESKGRYVSTGFTITQDDSDANPAKVACCPSGASMDTPKPHCMGTGEGFSFTIKNRNTRYATSKLAKDVQKRIGTDHNAGVYTITVSRNGLARFHIPNPSTMKKITFLRADSENCLAVLKNFAHAMLNGCFCFGIFYRNVKTGQIILMRWNRWNGNVSPYWCAVQEPK